MKNTKVKIGIIGCGVSGLSCGIVLLEAGFTNIQIFAKEIPPNTTSDVAPAVWRPFQLISEKLGMPWSKKSLDDFKKLKQDPDSGVWLMNLTEVYRRKRTKPKWMDAVDPAPTPYFPEQYPCAHSVVVPAMDTSIYMPYLVNKFNQLGGIITKKTVHHLNELNRYDFIINCSGIGARQLVKDKQVFPIRGQIIRVTKPAKLDYGIACEEKDKNIITYVYPRYHDCVLGGTFEQNQWELKCDQNTAKNILDRAKVLCPLLETAEIIEHKVGLRPGREDVRLDAEPLSMTTTVIHNYGHGGRGFTLSWGCAAEVLKIIHHRLSE